MEKDFLFMAGHMLGKMRLTVEGAVLMYENNVAACYQEALAAGRMEEALALDMLGTALHELRCNIVELQAAYNEGEYSGDVLEALRGLSGGEAECE